MTSSALAGTGALARLAFRRDRIMLPAWVYVITAAIASNSYSLNKLYPTAAARADLAASGGRNPALVFLYGRLWGDSLGAVSAPTEVPFSRPYRKISAGLLRPDASTACRAEAVV